MYYVGEVSRRKMLFLRSKTEILYTNRNVGKIEILIANRNFG